MSHDNDKFFKVVMCIWEGDSKWWRPDHSGTRSNTLVLAVLSVLSLWLEDLLEINPHAQQSYIINASTYLFIFTFTFSISFT